MQAELVKAYNCNFSGITNVILDIRDKVVPLQSNWQSFRVVTTVETA